MDKEKMKAKRLREMYPKGTKVVLESMEGERQMPDGLKGEVYCVDDAGQIHVQWENGSTLALVPGVDSFHKAAGLKEMKKNRGGTER